MPHVRKGLIHGVFCLGEGCIAGVFRLAGLGLEAPLDVTHTILRDLIVAPLLHIFLRGPRVLIKILFGGSGLEGMFVALTLVILKSECKIGVPQIGTRA